MDPTTQVIGGLLAIIGSYSALMVWLIKRQDSQIESLTNRFVTALETTVKANTEELIKMSSAMTELTTMVREDRAHGREEHRAIMDALGKARSRGSLDRERDVA